MELKIHRGTHQIGGCVTEITHRGTRIFIDFGSELPGSGSGKGPLEIKGLTCGEKRCDGVFFTHNHGDHMGEISRVLPDIDLYMGPTAKRLQILLQGRLSQVLPGEAKERAAAALEAVKRSKVYCRPGQPIQVGELEVTPLLVDHSAFDAYMLVIQGGGTRVLHTGDFRAHGYRGPVLERLLRGYARNIDWIVCEGTMLSRPGERVMTEAELSDRAWDIMKDHRRVFVLCSSTNIDRLEAFRSAVRDGRPIICDKFQKGVLQIITKHHARGDGRYDFSSVEWVDPDKEERMAELADSGFLCFLRANEFGEKMLERLGEGATVIYSQWGGYLDPQNPAANTRLISFLQGRDVVSLHTSGHADQETLKLLVDTVHPRQGLIPIHTERPEAFAPLLPGVTVRQLEDGETLDLRWENQRLAALVPEIEAAKARLGGRSPGQNLCPVLPGCEIDLGRLVRDRAHALYGAALPDFVSSRMDRELTQISGRYDALFLAARQIVLEANRTGHCWAAHPHGDTDSLLTAWLAGISDVNPLAPHYRCPVCGHAELAEGNAAWGPVLPEKVCPVCGAAYERDGFGLELPAAFDSGEWMPAVSLVLDAAFQRTAQEMAFALFGPDRLVQMRLGTDTHTHQAHPSPGVLLVVPEGMAPEDIGPFIEDPGFGRMTAVESAWFKGRFPSLCLIPTCPIEDLQRRFEETGVDPRSIPLDAETFSAQLEQTPADWTPVWRVFRAVEGTRLAWYIGR